MNPSPSIVVAAFPCDPQSQREATSPTPGRALTRALDTAPASFAPSASARGPRVIPHGGAAQSVNRRAVQRVVFRGAVACCHGITASRVARGSSNTKTKSVEVKPVFLPSRGSAKSLVLAYRQHQPRRGCHWSDQRAGVYQKGGVK